MTDVSGPLRKSPAAFRTISEASAELGVPQHVLRFWETRFSFISPMKRAGGRRFYRPQDLDVLRGVRALLQDEGYTIKGVQKLHKDQGLKRLVSASGLSEAVAAQVAAQVQADAAFVDGDGALADAPDEPAGTVAEPSAIEEPEGPETADLFGPRSEPVATVEPMRARAPEPVLALAPASARPVLETAARSRLAEVLDDLETTKAGIDALLRRS